MTPLLLYLSVFLAPQLAQICHAVSLNVGADGGLKFGPTELVWPGECDGGGDASEATRLQTDDAKLINIKMLMMKNDNIKKV